MAWRECSMVKGYKECDIPYTSELEREQQKVCGNLWIGQRQGVMSEPFGERSCGWSWRSDVLLESPSSKCETWNHTALPECYQLGGNAVFSIPLKMPQRMDAWLLNSREWYSGSWYPGHSSSLRSSSVWNVRRENLWNGYRDFTCGPQWPRMWGGFREWGWQTEQYTILCTIANRRGFDLIWDIPKHYQK